MPLLSITENTRHLHHIIWQPSFSCISNCKKCYVAAGVLGKRGAIFSGELYYLLFISKKISCDQLTLSLDNNPNPDRDLCKTIGLILDTYRYTPRHYLKYLPRLCITCHSSMSFFAWQECLNLSVGDLLSNVYMLSISNFFSTRDINTLKIATEITDTIFNYNCMASNQLLESPARSLAAAAANVTYLHLQKGVLGEELPDGSLSCYNEVKKVLVGEVVTTLRLHTDACLSYKEQGRACDAGLSMACVWPEDVVTGCPYDSNGIGRAAGSSLYERLMNVSSPAYKCRILDLPNQE